MAGFYLEWLPLLQDELNLCSDVSRVLLVEAKPLRLASYSP